MVRDNARNVVAAMEVGKFQHIPCLAHSLQLVVKDGCLDNTEICSITSICRRIVGHFKHSVNAYKLLRQSQELLGLPKHSIIQDEPTRWNSTYYMLNRLLEQKNAILLVTPQFGNASRQTKELTSEQWESLVPLVEALKIFEDVTKTVSSSSVTVSEIIPIINAVNVSLDKIDRYGNFKAALQESLHRRYGECESEPVYSIATILDPRFKNKIFKSKKTADDAVQRLTQELFNMEHPGGLPVQEIENSMTTKLMSAPGPVSLLYTQLLETHSKVSSFLLNE